jgi:hypothetical protein
MGLKFMQFRQVKLKTTNDSQPSLIIYTAWEPCGVVSASQPTSC